MKGPEGAPLPALRGGFGNLLAQNPEDLQRLLEEEAAFLWDTLHWQVEAWAGPTTGLAWTEGGKVLGYLPLRVSGHTLVVGRMFVTRHGPIVAIESALLDAAIQGAFSNSLLQRVAGELLLVAPGTFDWLHRRWPGQIRVRSLLSVAWIGSGETHCGTLLEPWQEQHLLLASALLQRAYAGEPHFLADPAFNNPQGIAYLLGQITTRPLHGKFQARASFVARAADSGELLGFVLSSRMGADQGHVSEVAVDPGARGRGLGKALVVRALSALQELGCRTTHLAVSQDNFKAVGLYRSLGFREYHQFPDLRLDRGA